MNPHKIPSIFFYLIIFTVQLIAKDLYLTGIVYDKTTGQPIAGVNITSEDIGTAADSIGRFEIVIPEKSSLSFSHIGYETFILKPEQVNLIVWLIPEVLSGLEVNVTATRVIPGITPVAYSTLTQDEIQTHYLMEDVPMVLRTEPGIHAYSESGNGTGYSYVSIRGFKQSKIAVMIDNVPLNDNESHQVYWVDHGDIISNAADVEIQRGVGNSLYGASAFGGSINVETQINSDKESWQFSSLGGSFNTYKLRAQYNSGKKLGQNLNLAARISTIQSDGYRKDSESDQKSLYFGLEHRLPGVTNQFRALIGKEISVLQWDGVDQNMIDDRVLRREKLAWTIPFTDDYLQQIYSLNTIFTVSKNVLLRNVSYLVIGRGYYQVRKPAIDYFRYNLDLNNEYPDSVEYSMSTDLTRRKWINNLYYGITPTLTLKTKSTRSDFGIELRNYTGDHIGEVIDVSDSLLASKLTKTYRYYDFTGSKQSVTVFGHLIYATNWGGNLVGDLQVQHHRWNLDQQPIGHAPDLSIAADWTFVNPRIGFSYQVTEKVSCFANYGVAQKEPADDQIYEADNFNPALDSLENPVHDQYGSFILRETPGEAPAEKINNAEIGLTYSDRAITGRLNFYRINYKNEILSDIYSFEETEFDIVTADRTEHTGIEFEGSCQLGSHLLLQANAAFSANRFGSGASSGKTLINVPGQLGNIIFTYQPTGSTKFVFHLSHTGRQYIDFDNSADLAIAPYTLLNISAQKTWNNITVKLKINNVLDELYATYGYEYWDGYYWPGATRNGYLALEMEI